MDYYQILVIILSVFLAIFLALAIAATILIIQISAKIKVIVEKAETVAGQVEQVGEFFQKTAGPVAIARLITNISDSFKSKKKS